MSISTEEAGKGITIVPTTPFQKVGAIVIGIGALYMVMIGWLSSWWIVPAIREGGVQSIDPIFFSVWASSTPLGAILLIIGAAMLKQIDRRILWLMIGGSLLMFVWSAIGSGSRVISAQFGIGGGLIMLFFLGSVWDWLRNRATLSESQKSGVDLRMIGLVFFLQAAWWLCGLLGAPTFLLRPEIASGSGRNLASMVLLCLILGWAFNFFGNAVALRSKNKSDV